MSKGIRLRCPSCDVGLYDETGTEPIYLDGSGKFADHEDFDAFCLSCHKRYFFECGARVRWTEQ